MATYKIQRGVLTSTPETDLTLVGNLRPAAFEISEEAQMAAEIFSVDDGVNSIREALLMMRVAAEIARMAGNADQLQMINAKISEYEFVLGGPVAESNTSEGRSRKMSIASEL